LKKIFAILLSLALVVSLGALTAAPVAATTMPSISPTSGTYDLDTPVQVTTTVKWGDTNAIASIVDIEGHTLSAASPNPDYVLYGSAPSDTLLVITTDYMEQWLTYVGDSITLVLSFELPSHIPLGIATFTITATGTTPGVSPTSATWVYGSDDAVTTDIIWGPAGDVSFVRPLGGADLTETTQWDQFGDVLLIYGDYLDDVGVLDGIGDSVVLEVEFDVGGSCTFTITATGSNPTISPATTTWVKGSSDVVTTTITFNSATATGFAIKKGAAVVAQVGNWELFGTLLVMTNTYLTGELGYIGDSVVLTLDFDVGECLLTIWAVGTDLPSISPESATWSLGDCDDDVTTTINWAGLSDHNITIQDVTVATAPIDLVQNTDFALSGNTLTFEGCLDSGNQTETDWGGLECVLDADVHQTRVIEITFADDPPTVVEFLISSTDFTAPSLSSTIIPYDLDMADDVLLVYVGALITWGDATGIEYISQLDEDGNVACNLTPDPTPPGDIVGTSPPWPAPFTVEEGDIIPVGNYMVAYNAAYGGWLVLFLKETYLKLASFTISDKVPYYPFGYPYRDDYCGANLTEIGDEVKVIIHWSPMNDTCGVGGEGTSYDDKFPATVVTITATGTSASMSPSSGEFNIDGPGNVTVEVDWGPHATSIAAITTGFDTLTEDEDWSCPDGDEDNPSQLIIDASYLEDELEEVGDTVVLDVDFSTGVDGKLTIEAVGTPLCFIATAAYGTPEAEEIDIIREFRDVVLRPNSLGAELVSLYYETSPPIAEFISQNEALRTAVRVGFIDPIVAILNWSHGLWS